MADGASTLEAPATNPTPGDDHDDRYAVQVHQLQHYFGEGDLKKQVLFDNALDVTRGEIVIMTGPSDRARRRS